MAFPSEQSYKDAVKECHSYNARLCTQRHQRLPYLDSQTGVAQSNCYLWKEKRHRGPGLEPGQWCSYPSRRWQKDRQVHLLEDPLLSSFTKPDAEDTLKIEGLIPRAGSSLRVLMGTNLGEKAAQDPSLGRSQVTHSRPEKQTLELQGGEEDWVGDYKEEEPKPRQAKVKAKAKGRRSSCSKW